MVKLNVTDPFAATPPTTSTVLELDLQGLRCPLPVLRARKALAALPRGGVIRILCTDPLAGIDIPHLVRETGDVLVAEERAGGQQAFTIRKA